MAIGTAALGKHHNRAVIYRAGTVKPEVVWELLLIFMDSAIHVLAEEVWVT